jgi:4-hydroxy-tetrahydrodipicolinate synthase
VTDIKPETVARLAKLPTVIGIKDASGDMPRVTDHRLACGPDFCLLSGVDEQSLAFNAAGGKGCISVTANVAPKLCAEFQAACASGDYVLARELNDKLYPLHLALFSDASPGPIKYALSRVIKGFPTELRLPMTPPSEASCRQVDAALENAGLI